MIDLMNRTSNRARILGPSGIALVVAAGLATPAFAQQAAPAAAPAAEATPQVVVEDVEHEGLIQAAGNQEFCKIVQIRDVHQSLREYIAAV